MPIIRISKDSGEISNVYAAGLVVSFTTDVELLLYSCLGLSAIDLN